MEVLKKAVRPLARRVIRDNAQSGASRSEQELADAFFVFGRVNDEGSDKYAAPVTVCREHGATA